MAARIRKDDIVVVISGVHKGARGRVLRINREQERVLIEGVNMVHRHVRKDRRNPQGGRIQKEAPVHMSNVQPLDPKKDRGVRVRFEVQRDDAGRVVGKQRVCAGRGASGAVLSEVTRGSRNSGGENG